MKFDLVDRIVELEPGQRIRTRKSLALAEEYLADHFPSFPVMPGVLMLECMTQSAAWLIRATDGFAHSLLWLEEARNVVYKSFVAPGNVLDMEVECVSRAPGRSEFSGKGRCSGTEVVKARIWVRHENLAGAGVPDEVDRELIDHARKQFALLGGVTAVAAGDPVGS